MYTKSRDDPFPFGSILGLNAELLTLGITLTDNNLLKFSFQSGLCPVNEPPPAPVSEPPPAPPPLPPPQPPPECTDTAFAVRRHLMPCHIVVHV